MLIVSGAGCAAPFIIESYEKKYNKYQITSIIKFKFSDIFNSCSDERKISFVNLMIFQLNFYFDSNLYDKDIEIEENNIKIIIRFKYQIDEENKMVDVKYHFRYNLTKYLTHRFLKSFHEIIIYLGLSFDEISDNDGVKIECKLQKN